METPELSEKTISRMRNRPYYAFLYAKNIIESKLPVDVEDVFISDPQSAYLYAKHVLNGRLPHFIENAFVIQNYQDNLSKEYISLYFQEFCNQKNFL